MGSYSFYPHQVMQIVAFGCQASLLLKMVREDEDDNDYRQQNP